jgi:Recombination endonuclease VII
MSGRAEITQERPWRGTKWWTGPLMRTQEGLCAWPPCQQSLRTGWTETGRWLVTVDHNHGCPIHDSTKAMACAWCVRGLVHLACNREAAVWDRRLEAGCAVPDDIRGYLEPWRRCAEVATASGTRWETA